MPPHDQPDDQTAIGAASTDLAPIASARLEHVNFTVSDPKKTADILCDIFGWTIRWEGPAKLGGYTVHVGTKTQYLALYTPKEPASAFSPDHLARNGGLNHIALLVDNLARAEAAILAKGFRTHSHGNYHPGRRFYFDDADGIEFEIVSYQS